MTKGVRRAGKTLKDAERRRLAKRSRAEYPVPGTQYSPPPGWAALWCDGGSRGNPGPAAAAFVLEDGAGTVLAAAAEPIGVATVAVAEYRAVVAGLEAALAAGVERVEVRTDSRLVAAQLGPPAAPVRSPAVRELRDRAVDLGRRIGTVSYVWVPGDANGRADRMVQDILV
jgi:ribonuclease HI